MTADEDWGHAAGRRLLERAMRALLARLQSGTYTAHDLALAELIANTPLPTSATTSQEPA